jgi:hypothetical protein
MERPTGITIIAIVYFVLGCLSLLWSALVFGLGGLGALFAGVFGAEAMAAASTAGAWSGFVGILAAIVQFAVGIGLLKMKRWAWFLAVIGVALNVIQGIAGMFSGGPFAFMCGILGLLLPVAVLIYLLTNRVRQVFGVGTG